MKKDILKVINFEEYKDRKREKEINREELLKLIRQIVTTK